MADSGTLQDAVVFIVGASSGIGRATAQTLARRGARLVLGARRGDRVEALAGELSREHRTEVLPLVVDAGDEASVKFAVSTVAERFGRLDHAFNCAGVGATHKPLAEIEVHEFDRVVRGNLFSTFLCMKYQLPLIIRSGGGSIVNTSSSAGLVGIAGSSDYSSAKHGVIGLSKCAAMDYASQNVRVNVVAPGPVLTEMFERWVATPQAQQAVADWTLMKRLGLVQEIAECVAFLMGGATFSTGSVVSCDGGLTVG